MVASVLALVLAHSLALPQARAERIDQAGWSYLRLSGTPREIGRAYGQLMSSEIADAHRAVRIQMQGTGKSWAWYRDTSRRLFAQSLDSEMRAEMEGMVEGLRSKNINLDFEDVLAFNAHIEVSGNYLPWLNGQASNKDSCSAFVAIGSQTSDGGIVMGHNLWWDYVVGQRFNVILDIQPEKGQRVMFDALVGLLHSGSDFAINSSGMMLCETTISGFKGYDPKGIPEFVRMRRAIQYGTDVDSMVAIFRKGNNGGYANTWLIGDTKNKEIAKLELGLKNVILHRTTDGAYVGSNFAEDPKLMREETQYQSSDRNPCEIRKARWNELMRTHRGRVDTEAAKRFLAETKDERTGLGAASGATLCNRNDAGLWGAVNTKVVDSAMVSRMQFWARMGFSDGSSARATDLLAKSGAVQYKDVLRDIPSQPWIMIPARSKATLQ